MSKAEKILTALGGGSNVVDLEPCITRLRVEVTDPALVDEAKLKETAKQVKSEPERRRIEAAAASISKARKSTQAAAAAPPAAKPAAARASALDVNASGMKAMGY